MKTTVFYHSADFDGIFCREIARKFLPDAELIGWNFGDPNPAVPDGQIYVMDLPIDRLFDFQFDAEIMEEKQINAAAKLFREGAKNIIWIDHHRSSIESHPDKIPGYRIDGVAACRLAWQWFSNFPRWYGCRPEKQDFVDRKVDEPLAVRLAGEYDVHDPRMKTEPEIELFQHGLRSRPLNPDTWNAMLSHDSFTPSAMVADLVEDGKILQFARDNEYAKVITTQGFDIEFAGLTFLACNSHELDIRSQLFAAGIKPHHDALLGFTFTGHDWRVSLYRIDGREADILRIAKEYGGGGHPGACGFNTNEMASILGSTHF